MAAIAMVTAIYPVQRKMIDLHTHVIYGVDDGSRSAEMSREMLRQAAAGGVSRICCTTNVRPGHRAFPAQPYRERIEELQAFLTEEALTNIADTTLENVKEFFETEYSKNEVCYNCPEVIR